MLVQTHVCLSRSDRDNGDFQLALERLLSALIDEVLENQLSRRTVVELEERGQSSCGSE